MLAPNNRGIALDLVVFVVNLLLLRALGMVAHHVVHGAVEDVRAKLAIGLFFAGLILIQPVGPVLKRWSFHRRHAFSTESGAGCLLFWFMFVYVAMMFVLCGVAAVVLGEVFSAGADASVAFALAGFAWSIVSVVLVYRYFVRPQKPPRWTFLTTPAAERLGDTCIYLNAIGLQILWGGATASAPFTEIVTQTPLGRPGSVTDVIGRLVATAACAALLYFPARIFYLVEDKHRALTWATILLANLPLILRIAFARA
ncbi:MAG TPA: hypothetical protein VGC72_15365 [Candidatus Elarobacter sp.]|jgi:hypothetical protein